MTKAAVLVLLVALLGGTAHASKVALQNTCNGSETTCSASASLFIQVIGPGSCSGSANSYCGAWAADSGDCIDVASIYVGGDCRPVDVTKDASCWAAAAAKAVAAAIVEVDCNGNHAFGCGQANANAKAIACALAAAIVDIAVDLGTDGAECYAQVVVVIEAMVTAIANAQAACCSVNNAPCIDSDFEFAAGFQKVLATAFARCWVYCDDDGNASSGASGGGSGTILTESGIQFGGGQVIFGGK